MLCIWCKGDFDDIEGPVHEYMESTPGCWAAYSKLLSIEYENYTLYRDIHRLTVDTYGVQHPGQPSRKSIQSVWGHLIAMRFYLEQGLDGDTTRWRLGQFLEQGHDLTWLPPPDFSDTLKVSHVLAASSSTDHICRVREWGNSVYACWTQMHASEIEGMFRRAFK